MDIEPLWALGGWSFLSKCMALPKTQSPISESNFSKSPTLIQFLTLLFILLILINLSHQPNPSSMASSSDQSAMSTTSLHPQKTKNSHGTTSSKGSGRDQFGADAHEVPSGPNPISN